MPLKPRARCPPGSTARRSRSSRRAMPAHGDLATNAAMVLAKGGGDQPARARRADRAEARGAARRHRGRGRRARGSSICGWPTTAWRRELATILAEGERYGRRTSARASGSMSNMSRPTRPGRCTWAIAAARWSAMRWPACSRRRASPSPANIMSTTPAARSTRSPARRTCATARRSARTSARFPKGSIRATI